MSIDQTPSAFWDRVARRYAAMSMRNPAAWEATLERVQAHLGPQDRVLELGCGTGSTALRLASLVEQYIATNYSAEMIAIAREKQVGTDLENLDFHVSKIGNDDLPGGPFDAVLAFNVLHLLPDRQLALRVIFDLLRPGGLFISKTMS